MFSVAMLLVDHVAMGSSFVHSVNDYAVYRQLLIQIIGLVVFTGISLILGNIL